MDSEGTQLKNATLDCDVIYLNLTPQTLAVSSNFEFWLELSGGDKVALFAHWQSLSSVSVSSWPFKYQSTEQNIFN